MPEAALQRARTAGKYAREKLHGMLTHVVPTPAPPPGLPPGRWYVIIRGAQDRPPTRELCRTWRHCEERVYARSGINAGQICPAAIFHRWDSFGEAVAYWQVVFGEGVQLVAAN